MYSVRCRRARFSSTCRKSVGKAIMCKGNVEIVNNIHFQINLSFGKMLTRYQLSILIGYRFLEG